MSERKPLACKWCFCPLPAGPHEPDCYGENFEVFGTHEPDKEFVCERSILSDADVAWARSRLEHGQ